MVSAKNPYTTSIDKKNSDFLSYTKSKYFQNTKNPTSPKLNNKVMNKLS